MNMDGNSGNLKKVSDFLRGRIGAPADTKKIIKKYMDAPVLVYYDCPLGVLFAFKGKVATFIIYKDKFGFGSYNTYRIDNWPYMIKKL